MKKLFLLLLALVVALSVLVACSDESVDSTNSTTDSTTKAPAADEPSPPPACDTHTDENKDFKCDTCSKSLPYTGDVLSDKVIAQIKDAKSFKIEIVKSVISDESTWYESDVGPIEEKDYHEMIDKIYVTVSYDENGKVRAMAELETSYTDTSGETETTERAPYLYIVDGFIYTYDKELDGYAKSEMPVEISEVEAVLEALTKGVELDEETKAELLAKIGEFAITSFNIVENKGTVSVDLKDELNAYIKCFADLDPENDTLEDFLNSIIAVTGFELSINELLTNIFDNLGLTVKEATEALNAWCLENNKKSLQETYDELVADPAIEKLIKNLIEYTAANAPEEPEMSVDELYEKMFLEFSVEELLASDDMAEITVYELLLGFSGNPTEEMPTLEELKETVFGALALTLIELESGFDVPVISLLAASISQITVDAFDIQLDINFKGVLNIDSVILEFNVGSTTKSPTEYEGKEDIDSTMTSIIVKLYDINNEMQEIALDESKEIYLDYYNRHLSSAANGEDYMYVNCYFGETYIEMYFNYEGNEICVISESIPLDTLKSLTVRVPGDKLSFSSYDANIKYEANGELVVEIDETSRTYTVVSMPLFSIADNVYDAIKELGEGEGIDNSDKYDLDTEFGGYIRFLGSEIITINLSDDYYISSIEAEYHIDEETGAMVCTIVYLTCESTSPMLMPDLITGWYGGTREDISIYFGGEETFIIYVDENGIIKNDGIPDILEIYRDID